MCVASVAASYAMLISTLAHLVPLGFPNTVSQWVSERGDNERVARLLPERQKLLPLLVPLAAYAAPSLRRKYATRCFDEASPGGRSADPGNTIKNNEIRKG